MSGDNRLSFTINAWQRLKSVCSAVKQTESHAVSLKAAIEAKLQSTARSRKKKADVQGCELELGHLRSQIDWRKSRVRTLTSKFVKLRKSLERREHESAVFVEEKMKIQQRRVLQQRDYLTLRESILQTSALLLLRRKQMLQEVYDYIFPIIVASSTAGSTSCSCEPSFQIAGIHLPDAESYPGHDDQATAIALSNVAHYILIVSRILNLPLRYKILLFGSRSAVEDHISEKLVDVDRVFPLFGRGQDKLRYAYAVFLLNKNIAQFRCFCALSTKDLRCTLSNMKDLIEFLVGAKLEPQHQMRPLSVMHMSGSALALGDVARGSQSIKVGSAAAGALSVTSDMSIGSNSVTASPYPSPASSFASSAMAARSTLESAEGFGKFFVQYDHLESKEIGRKKAYTVAVGADCFVGAVNSGKMEDKGQRIQQNSSNSHDSNLNISNDPHSDKHSAHGEEPFCGNVQSQPRCISNGIAHHYSPSLSSTASSSGTQSRSVSIGEDGVESNGLGRKTAGRFDAVIKDRVGLSGNPVIPAITRSISVNVEQHKNSDIDLLSKHAHSASAEKSKQMARMNSKSESVIVEALGSELTFVEQFARDSPDSNGGATDEEQIRRGKLIGAEFHVDLNSNC